jgi:hypothetical protein
MMLRWITAALLFSAVPSIIFCQTNTGAADSLHHPQQGILNIFEKSFRPSEYDADLHLKSKNSGDTTRHIAIPPDTFAVAPPDTVQGYRIQVLATNDFDEATSARNSLTIALPKLWVYMVYDAPTYKIRVGDYVNRSDAYLSLDSLVAMGYKEAWIVPDRVIKNPPPKPVAPTSADSTSEALPDSLIKK